MDTYLNESDFALLEKDKYSFAVLDRILSKECVFVRTDHRDLIVCHSDRSHPLWIWTSDGCPEEVKEKAWQIVSEERFFEDGFRINLKYELADYLTRRAKENGTQVKTHLQMMAYDCPVVIEPEKKADGGIFPITPDTVEELMPLYEGFRKEENEPEQTHDESVAHVLDQLDIRPFFVWKNAEGVVVACCNYRLNQGLGSIGFVYTRPEYRRRHYAQNMVYQTAKKLSDMGYMPMLYTDENYPASNACYQKIGFTLRGRICTIGADKEN